jgi:hypothetical protein
VSVGELIATVHEDGDTVGIPVLVVLDAWNDLTADERNILMDLVERDNSPVAVIPIDVAAIPTVSGLAHLGYGTAHTVAAVLSLGATVATYTPQAYAAALDHYDVLELS